MDKTAGLQLSLNTIITFTIAIMIFSAGIMFFFSVVSKAPEIERMDNCEAEVRNKITAQNELFAICPSSITANPIQLRQGIPVTVGINNVDSRAWYYYPNITGEDGDGNTVYSRLRFAPIAVSIGARSYRIETYTLRIDDAFPGETIFGRIVFCKSPSSPELQGISSFNCGQLNSISRVISIEVR